MAQKIALKNDVGVSSGIIFGVCYAFRKVAFEMGHTPSNPQVL